MGSPEPDVGPPGPRDVVVVPHRPGPLIVLDVRRNRRGRDDLDELIDDLLPEVDEGPGWFDAAVVALGLGLLAWAWIATAPVFVTVVGVVALFIGCTLPVRAAWRSVGRSRERRRLEALLDKGLPLDLSSPGPARLVGAYEDLLGLADRSVPASGDPAIAAAHGALLEVASLLDGRAPGSERERGYVDKRSAAVADLVDALRELSSSGSEATPRLPSAAHPDAVVDARDELARITPFNSVTHLEELVAETRIRRRDRG